ncbi:MAG: cytochrome c-type biogenesis protein [Candidatus Rokuibacteriota bacterium]
MGVEPQHDLALLQVKGLARRGAATIGALAERRHGPAGSEGAGASGVLYGGMSRGSRASSPIVPVALTLVVAALALVAGAGGALAQQPARHAEEQVVHEIAARLRCVVCQNLSVADSPSEMANQMRGVVRERLAAGETPEQVVQYFVDKYGEWILLEPRRRGFTLLVWIVPPIAVVAGLAVVAALLVRWTRRGRAARPAATPVDPAMAERIRREMEREA